MLDYEKLFQEVRDKIPAYNKFLEAELHGKAVPERFEDLPLLTKQKYLLTYDLKELCRQEDMKNFHLIGASSGFSKTGTVYWPKQPSDEVGYMDGIASMFDDSYGISRKRTLVLECLAFGMWIGGMQIAAAMRYIALSGKYPLTLATPGLDLKAAATVVRDYKDLFEQILVITNPSNISLFTALLEDMKVELPAGMVSFPVVGEYFSESFREHVARKYGHDESNPYVVRTGYGSADTGYIANELESTIRLRKYFSHRPELSEEWFGTRVTPMMLGLSSPAYVEVINGNLVVTKDQFIPLVRYDTGDAGGMLDKTQLKGVVDDALYDSLPEKILYVMGRVSNAVIFYGTNLIINDISDFLMGVPSDKHYGGLFTVHEREERGIACLDFTIYVTDMTVSKDWYFNALIDFLCKQSAEFNIKYRNLSKSVDVGLINVILSDIKMIDSKVKHRYII